MEPKANYAAIGLFVLVMIGAGLGFLFWLTNAGQRAAQADIRIVFSGPVTGLTTGSGVQFNGIKVGEVVDLSLDENDPNTVIAHVRVDRDKPIRTDTRAILSYQGLTGVANLELQGGSRNAPLLLDTVEPGGVPTIHADISPFQDIMESARNVLTRADSAMAAIDDFVTDNGPAFNRTVNNVETFSRALAENSDGVDEMLRNVSSAAQSLSDIAGTLQGTARRAEEILAAVDPARVTEMVDNLTRSSERLEAVLARTEEVVQGVDPAVVNTAVQNVADAAAALRETIAQAESVLTGLDPAEVDALVGSIRQTSDTIAATARRADEILAAVDPQRIGAVVEQAEAAAGGIADASRTVNEVVQAARESVDRVTGVVAAVDPAKVGATVEDVSAFAAKLRENAPQVDAIMADVKSASEDLRALGDTIGDRNADIDAIITEARALSERLNVIADRADGVLAKVDAYVEGDGEGLIAEATATLASIRTVAETLNQRIGPITADIARFTGRGLDSYARLADEGRRALSRLDRVLSGIERDPQQFIFGAEGVPEYAPRRR